MCPSPLAHENSGSGRTGGERVRRTRIVATLGPATDEAGALRDVIEAGTDVVRLNASHGTQEEHRMRIEAVRAISKELHRTVGILLDLQGPKIRVGDLPKGGVPLRAGDTFVLTNRSEARGAGAATVDYEPLP